MSGGKGGSALPTRTPEHFASCWRTRVASWPHCEPAIQSLARSIDMPKYSSTQAGSDLRAVGYLTHRQFENENRTSLLCRRRRPVPAISRPAAGATFAHKVALAQLFATPADAEQKRASQETVGHPIAGTKKVEK